MTIFCKELLFMYNDFSKCTHSEMDIISAFEAGVPGSNPGECTAIKQAKCFACVQDSKGFSIRAKRGRKAPATVGREIPGV